MDREKLIEELRQTLDFVGTPYAGFERIADFILADRRRICQPLLKTDYEPVKNLTAIGLCEEYAIAIRETLKLADLEDK